MNLLKKIKNGLKSLVSRGIPENLWIKCDRCHQSVFRRQVEQGSGTCPNCGGHFRIGQREYFALLIDEGSFEEVAGEVKSKDFLKFKDRISYSERLKQMRKKTGLKAAIYTGIGRIDGRDVGVGIHEIGFIGGSLGSAEGERICRLIDRCILGRLPLVLVCRSGGARMQEGAMSLMQMAKISAKLADFSREGLPYIAILCDPTTAGVSGSYGMLGDVNIAEPDALIGYTGERITGSSVPEEQEELRRAQRAELMFKNGFLDMIVQRADMKRTVSQMLALLCD